MKELKNEVLTDIENSDWYISMASEENIRECLDKINSRELPFYGQLGYVKGDLYGEISLSKISHQIKNLRLENKKIIGDVIILDTKCGLKIQESLINFAKEDLRFKFKWGIRLFGVCTNLNLEIKEIISWDILN